MVDNYTYSVGNGDKDAPYNEPVNTPKEIDVLISITMSKSFKIKVTDYITEVDDSEDGCTIYNDFSECDLETAAKEQIVLPQDAPVYIEGKSPYYKEKALKDLQDWHVDEFEVIREP